MLEAPSIFSKLPVFGGTPPTQVAWLVSAAFVHGASVPAIFELGAELTFARAPSAEVLSASMIIFLWNFSNCMVMALQTAPGGLSPPTVNFVSVGHFLMAALLAKLFLRTTYGRTDAEPEEDPMIQRQDDESYS
jgi:hypothetical protein